MMIPRIVFCAFLVCLLSAGPASPDGVVPELRGESVFRSRPSGPEAEVRGKIVYINRIAGQIIVMDENNTKRRVRVSPLQMKRMRVGQGVDMSLRDGNIPARSIRIMRRNQDREIVPKRW